MTAIRSGHPHIADYLLTIQYIDANVKDNNNWTALLFAADMGWAQLVRKLIEDYFVDVNNVSSDGMTALIIAGSNGHLSVVNYLLEVKDLDVNRFDSLGYTALMYATENGFLEVVKILIEKGYALVSLHGARAQHSPFEIAIKNGYEDIIKYFSDFSYGYEEKSGNINLEVCILSNDKGCIFNNHALSISAGC
jgi:ankyrin repeat protein